MFNKGILNSLAANASWGFAPIFWKQLSRVPSVQMLAHRIVWSLLLLMGILLVTSQFRAFRETAFERRTMLIYSFSGILMGVNLFLSVWSVIAGYIVEMSLGYFISPLVNVLLGVIFLREKLRKWQWVSVTLAVIGVLIVAIAYGKFPWLALTLSSTFGLYGLVKKKAPLSSLHGITLELGIFLIPAIIYLIVVEIQETAVFLHIDWELNVYILASSIVTIGPLVFYSAAAKLIPLTLLGILQYIAPSLQFLVGVFIYNEDFTIFKLGGFICVWIGLIIFTVESIHFSKTKSSTPVETPRDEDEEASHSKYEESKA